MQMAHILDPLAKMEKDKGGGEYKKKQCQQNTVKLNCTCMQ